MGRRQATFREGIGEEQRHYAQTLRDVRNLRGETQAGARPAAGLECLEVSRFEAASERPDRATHRRHCALAPTEELRQQLASAYEALPPLNGTSAAPPW
jgi:hypothetical protein